MLPGESLKRGGLIVKNHKRIARHYLTGWFAIDFVSVLPVDTMLMVAFPNVKANAASDTDGQAYVEVLRVVRMMRLFRLVKLFRILRASRIFARMESSVAISYSKRELLKWMTIVVLLIHFLACALGLLAQLTPTQRTPELMAAVASRMADGYTDNSGAECYGCADGDPADGGRWCLSACLTPCEIDLLARSRVPADSFEGEVAHETALVFKSETWICRFNSLGMVDTPANHAAVWVAAVYVSLIQLSGGVGSIYPENVPEYILFIVGILIGSVIWAMVVGTICAMFTMGDPHTTDYHQTMDELNSFLAEASVPSEMGVQARAYLRSTRELRKKLSYDELMVKLSPGLRGEIMLHLSKSTFARVWYLEVCEAECLVQLAARLTRHGFPPRERMKSTTLNIIMRGIAACGGELLYSGMCWGSDIILSAVVLRDTRLITALTYVEVQALSRDDLYEVLESFPESAKTVQNAAVRMALKRTVVLLKAYADAQAVDHELDGSGGSAAYSMLTAAFNPAEPTAGAPGAAPAADLGQIFRIITGAKLRDVDIDGNLVEQIESSPAGIAAMSEAEERRHLRNEVTCLREEMRDVHRKMDSVSRLLQQMAGKPLPSPQVSPTPGGRGKS